MIINDCSGSYDNFIKYSRKIFNIVSKNLGLEEYIKFGLRYWYLYPVDSVKAGREILHKSHVFSDNKKIEELFGKKIKDKSVVIILGEGEKGHRIALALAKKKEIDDKIEES